MAQNTMIRTRYSLQGTINQTGKEAFLSALENDYIDITGNGKVWMLASSQGNYVFIW
jgi:hypothetical protein